ncbi:MAG: BrnT family toxin [Candidatus Omnitrophica bacterium]|nr:BrnT family toxin [Candidatus Omnitrophota bacterium]
MIQIRGFEWDPGNLEHIHEHGVRDYEVEEVLLFDEPVYYKGREGRYCAFGVTGEGRYLFIVFEVKEHGLIRVVTARNMTRSERKLYNKRR